jgi:hypothetical protein
MYYQNGNKTNLFHYLIISWGYSDTTTEVTFVVKWVKYITVFSHHCVKYLSLIKI